MLGLIDIPNTFIWTSLLCSLLCFPYPTVHQSFCLQPTDQFSANLVSFVLESHFAGLLPLRQFSGNHPLHEFVLLFSYTHAFSTLYPVSAYRIWKIAVSKIWYLRFSFLSQCSFVNKYMLGHSTILSFFLSSIWESFFSHLVLCVSIIRDTEHLMALFTGGMLQQVTDIRLKSEWLLTPTKPRMVLVLKVWFHKRNSMC